MDLFSVLRLHAVCAKRDFTGEPAASMHFQNHFYHSEPAAFLRGVVGEALHDPSLQERFWESRVEELAGTFKIGFVRRWFQFRGFSWRIFQRR